MDDGHRFDATLKYKFEGLLIMVWIIGAQFNPFTDRKSHLFVASGFLKQ
jgi:hypothetical protein